MISSKQRFHQLSKLSGIIYREQPGRKTFASQINDEEIFIKLHHGVGWREIFKNLLLLKWPIVGARNEYLAIQKLHQLNLATLDALEFGEFGINPATRSSFLVTRALKNTISLETLCETWPIKPPDLRFKRHLIAEVAKIAATMHYNGINHRDFYICHFLLDEHYYQATHQLKIYLIDLHRAQMRKKIPWRWHVKDIAGLYFSALRIGLTRRDFFYFMQVYKKFFNHHHFDWQKFWFEVEQRAWLLYEKTYYAKQKDIFKTMRFIPALSLDFQQAFFNDPDLIMAQGYCLKQDVTTTVVKYKDNHNNCYVIKRYNAKTWKLWVKRFFKISRARRCWLQAIRLRQLGLYTPEPIAMMTHRMINQSYFITRFLEGEDLIKKLAKEPETLPHWLLQIKIIFRALAAIYTAHGDMKATNLWCHHNRIYLLDLDGIARYCNNEQLDRALQKDKQRFLKNWKANPELWRKFNEIIV